jgi:hypothetical protein
MVVGSLSFIDMLGLSRKQHAGLFILSATDPDAGLGYLLYLNTVARVR